MEKSVARIGVFVALAMVFSYIEVLIPFNFGIPGVKLGITNIVVVSGLYFLDIRDIWVVSLIRIVWMGILFGNGVSLIYSMSGGILSLLVMMLLMRRKWFSVTGVSIAGGVFHNIGQLLAATIVLQNRSILYYLPVLLVAGILTGALIGMLSEKVIRALKAEKAREQ